MPQSECLSRHPRPHILSFGSVLARKIESGGNIALETINRTVRLATSASHRLAQLVALSCNRPPKETPAVTINQQRRQLLAPHL
jgi:hypothetical protein